MTRKQAISQAIQILSQDSNNNVIIEKLQDILDEIPLSSWTEKSIIDAIENYAIEHNNILPHTKELTTENSLPSNTVIYNKFGISSINVFYQKYLSKYIIEYNSSSPYSNQDYSYFLETFIKNYLRIKKE
ncbi:MAG: hypothetical protein NC419_02040, partial [Muribaculaceae bacterium]|nr:hypothetical protein [Muribaculaceae bacterium]